MDLTPVDSFYLQVLGVPSLKDTSGVTPPSLGWGKPLALLCLLAVRGEARREEVVDLLWRDVPEDKAKNAFRQALHRLRNALGDDLIPQDRERIKLVRSSRITVDLDQYEHAAAAGRFDAAIQSYVGDFLQDSALDEAAFDHWAEQERTKLRVSFRHVLQNAIASATASGDSAQAIVNAKRLMVVAPFEASAAQVAATTLISAGRRVEAQELLRQFAARLENELGLPMPPELQSLTSRIERQERAATPATAIAGVVSLPFVGRESELSQLLSSWSSIGADAGALVLVEGDAGSGKTRLLRELASHAKALGPALVLSGSERAAGPQLPYGVFAEALRPIVRAKGIVGASRHLLAEAARLLPELRDEIDLPTPSDIEDDAGRLRFFEGIAALIDAVAFEQSVLILLEDAQFIPPSSLDLLSYLAVRLAGSAVMFAITLRPADAAPTVSRRLLSLAEATSSGGPPHGPRAKLLKLAPLSLPLAVQALENATKAIGLSAQQIERAARQAQGNPAQLLELARRMVAREDLPGQLVDARSLLRERAERLSSVQRRTLLALALVGRPVDAAVLAGATHLSIAAVLDTTRDLTSIGLAEHQGDSIVVAPGAAEVLLANAGENGRAFLAGWAADALAQDGRASAAELARLYAMAGVAGKAFDLYRRAALDALAIAAVQESVQFLMSARTFADTAEQQHEVESFLSALGSGRRRLAASKQEVAETSTASVPSSESPPSAGWRALFPNWRLLLGSAVATLVLSAAILAARPEPIRVTSRRFPGDTLVLREGTTGHIRFITASASGDYAMSDRSVMRPSSPAWIDSLKRPWIDPIAEARGRSVAVTRVTATGSDVYVITADRHDTTVLLAGQGDARPLGWSPDGRWVLAISSRAVTDNRGFATSLLAFRVTGSPQSIPIDTSSRHSVTEAIWSPDGSRVAWVARTGETGQLEVFASRADGTEMRNISRDPADDYHIAWSGDGDLLAFTSTRDGNAEVYAHSFRENRVWRLTFDDAQDDRAAFSRGGHLVAFESTRGGTAGIYVMPSLGGAAQRIAQGSALVIAGWESGTSRFVDRVRASVRSELQVGDTAAAGLAAFDQFDEPVAVSQEEWSVLDSSVATLLPRTVDLPPRLVALRPGLARIVANLGHWRSDTAYVRIGNRALTLFDASNRLHSWTLLGDPAPRESGPAERSFIAINADREWDSGILSRSAVPLLPGLSVRATITAPFSSASDAATALAIALVAPDEPYNIDRLAPQFLRFAALSWNAESGRLVYSVGRELFSEPVAAIAQDSAEVVMRIEHDSTVAFSVNGRVRWRSTLRISDAARDTRANVWIGGRATGDRMGVSDVSVALMPIDSTRLP